VPALPPADGGPQAPAAVDLNVLQAAFQVYSWSEPVHCQFYSSDCLNSWFLSKFRQKMAFGPCRKAQSLQELALTSRKLSGVKFLLEHYHNIIIMLYHQSQSSESLNQGKLTNKIDCEILSLII
jgi:hypothetical protein